ncbi:SAC3/GANP/Nin1/mts3/eIF-3 p25 family-domain-containing protein [Phascolomyces articulosus]|uniref:SAC3/GANP/Nin1/mts3/eIF-3 p25 family-domain-containing protein n=1 Tax=Phascolomyces articulosus TaxID=60185 RepID=A0AAD5P6Z1_9FUNG|nr:SAC3/GANP/Nin1/mts3/eIF-3 p25 family-domain-containing protein [Phascolomyces articulosus]
MMFNPKNADSGGSNSNRGGNPRGRGRGRQMTRRGGGVPHNNSNNQHSNNNSTKNNSQKQQQRNNKHWNRSGGQQQQQQQQERDLSPMRSSTPKSAMSAEQRLKRFGDTDKSLLYTRMKEDRVIERQEAIRTGQIADPDIPMRLEDAIDFRGTCTSMCPAFELVEREVQNMLDNLEVDAFGNADQTKAVKRYRRSAAGNEQPLPSDVRPPTVLVKTLDYLFNDVLMSNPFITSHGFLWDRTRAIRQDFTLQNIRDINAVEVHERVARFHILALHELCEYDEEKFSQQQEMEQLGKVLISLNEFYDDLRQDGVNMVNEGEFRAYHLIYNIRDHELASRIIATVPKHVQDHPYLKQAFAIYNTIQRNNEIMQTAERRNKAENILAAQNYYANLFKIIGSGDTPFLLACMTEAHFAEIRKGAFKSMQRAYIFNYKGLDVEYLRQILAYDDEKHFLIEAELYGLVIERVDNTVNIRFGQKTKGKTSLFVEPLSLPRQRRSRLLVDPKKGNRTYRDIINGDKNSDLHICTIIHTRALQPSRLSGVTTCNTTFIPDKDRHLLATHVVTGFPVVQRIVNAPITYSVEELAARERQRTETQRRQMQQAALIKQQQELQQRQAELQEQIRVVEERKQREMAAVKAAQEAAQKKRQQQAAQERAVMLERQQRQAMLAELSQTMAQDILQSVVTEEIQVAALNTLYQNKTLKKKMTPCLEKARTRITHRHQLAKERGSLHRLVDRLSKRILKPSCAAVKAQRVRESLYLEKRMIQKELKNPQPNEDRERSIWKTENYAEIIRPLLNFSNGPREWQLWIYIDYMPLQSSKWFASKFGLDEEFGRRIEHFDDGTKITVRKVSPHTRLYSKAIDELGAIVFSLSEVREPGSDDLYNPKYWKKEKERLDKMTSQLLDYNPHIRVPILFTYWPQTQNLENAVQKIPDLLALHDNLLIGDYHIIIMDPYTIAGRLHEEIRWLASTANTVYNTICI